MELHFHTDGVRPGSMVPKVGAGHEVAAEAADLGKVVVPTYTPDERVSHSHSSWGQVHAVGGTRRVQDLPEVGAKQAKVGEFGVFDNNLSAMGQNMRERVQTLGESTGGQGLANVGFVSQTTDPVEKTTLRVLDDQGGVPYKTIGNKSGSVAKHLQTFVHDHLFGATGGTASGAHDLILENHGGAIWGWGQSADMRMMQWPDAMNAIKDGTPSGQKLRALVLNMCMTGGSSEAVVEASDKQVADVMIGSEDVAEAGGIHQDRILKALNENPNMSGEELLQHIIGESNPKSKNTRFLTMVGVTLDQAKSTAFTDAFKNLSDLLKAKGSASLEVRQQLRDAFSHAQVFANERSDDFRNRDVKELMQLIRANTQDAAIDAATRQVDAAHDALILVHGQNAAENRAGRGLSVHAAVEPLGDGLMHLNDGGFKPNDYKRTVFDQRTGWSGVLEMLDHDQLQVEAAESAIRKRDNDAAIPLLRDAVADNPKNVRAQNLLGRLLGKDRATADEAVTTLKGAARHLGFGTLPAIANRRDQAIALLKRGPEFKDQAIAQFTAMSDQLGAYVDRARANMPVEQYNQVMNLVQKEFEKPLMRLLGLQEAQGEKALKDGQPEAAIKPLGQALGLVSPSEPVQMAAIAANLKTAFEGAAQVKLDRAKRTTDPGQAKALETQAMANLAQAQSLEQQLTMLAMATTRDAKLGAIEAKQAAEAAKQVRAIAREAAMLPFGPGGAGDAVAAAPEAAGG